MGMGSILREGATHFKSWLSAEDLKKQYEILSELPLKIVGACCAYRNYQDRQSAEALELLTEVTALTSKFVEQAEKFRPAGFKESIRICKDLPANLPGLTYPHINECDSPMALLSISCGNELDSKYDGFFQNENYIHRRALTRQAGVVAAAAVILGGAYYLNRDASAPAGAGR